MLDKTASLPDMTPREFQAATTDLMRTIGPKAHTWAAVSSRDRYTRPGEAPLSASVYLHGGHECTFRVEAETFRDLLAAIEAKWASYSDRHRVETIRAMALEIIRITALQGACSDAALRAGTFSAEDVK